MKAFKTVFMLAVMAALLGSLSACAVTDVHRGQSLAKNADWALLPIVNYAQEPEAGHRAEAILSTLLRKRGIENLQTYPDTNSGGFPELNDQKVSASALQWARKQHLRYAVRGSVEEWEYKSGLDGEPAVGITIQVIDVPTGKVLWSASGARSGWGYGTLSGTAQKLLNNLLSGMPLE